MRARETVMACLALVSAGPLAQAFTSPPSVGLSWCASAKSERSCWHASTLPGRDPILPKLCLNDAEHHFFSSASVAAENPGREEATKEALAFQRPGAKPDHEIARESESLKRRKRNSERGLSRQSDFPETLRDVVERKGSLSDGYLVLDRLQESLERGGSTKPLSAKFFSMLMSLCVSNIRSGRATLGDAYGVMQRCDEAGVEPDTILYNALLAAVSQEAGRGRASLADATSVMQQLRARGLRPDIRTMNTLMDITAKVAGSKIDDKTFEAGDEEEEPMPVTPMSAQSILLLIEKEGLHPNIWTYTSLMSLYAKCAGRGSGVGAGGGEVSLALADKVCREMVRKGIQPTTPFVNSYMVLIAKLALHADARLRDGYNLLAWAEAESVSASASASVSASARQ